MIEWDYLCPPPSSLGKHQPGFQGDDKLIWCDGVPLRMNMPSPWLPGEHCALC